MQTFSPLALAALVLSSTSLPALQHTARVAAPASTAAQALPAGGAIASEGELTAVLFESDATQAVYVAVSDGRALAFQAPVRIDTDAGGHAKLVGAQLERSAGVLAVRGSTILATWLDQRNAGTGGAGGAEAVDVYLARSLDGGATWQTDQPIPKGHAPGGLSPVMDYAMAVSANGQHVYVLQSVDPNYFGGSTTELWLAASHDGGATFAPATRLAATSTFQLNLALALDGDDVHVAFTGQLAGTVGFARDVFHLASVGGAAFPATPTQVDLGGVGIHDAENEVSLAARDGIVALAWPYRADLGAFRKDPYAAVSVDGGASFTPPAKVGTQPAGSVYLRGTSLAIAADGGVVLAWNDDRHGALVTQTSAFVSRSADGGETWAPEVELSGTSTAYAHLAGNGQDLSVTWLRDWSVESAFSRDGGATWSTPAIDVSGADDSYASSSVFMLAPAYNALYDNSLAAWVGLARGDPSKPRVFAGGYRLSEVVPAGFSSGDLAHVDLASFSGDAPFAWVVFSAAPGDLALPFGDGRNLGLAYDALLALSLASPAVLLAPLAPGGSGATASFPIPFAPGTELYAAAVSLAFAPGVALGEVTDVAAITVE